MVEGFEQVRQRQVDVMRAELAAAKDRLTWPLEKVHGVRDERLRELLAHAKERSPWHRSRLDHIDPHEVSGDDLSALPVMTKSDLMANCRRWVGPTTPSTTDGWWCTCSVRFWPLMPGWRSTRSARRRAQPRWMS